MLHNRGVPLYTGHFTRSPRCPQQRGSTVYRTLHQVPKVSTIEGLHCIQDTSPGPQGVHNRGVPLYTGHFTRSPRCPQQRGSTVYRTLHQVPKVSTIEGFHCIQDTSPGPKVSTIEGFHCIQDTSPGLQGVHNRGAPLYTGHFTRSPRCLQQRGSTVYRTLHQVPKVSTIEGFHCTSCLLMLTPPCLSSIFSASALRVATSPSYLSLTPSISALRAATSPSYLSLIPSTSRTPAALVSSTQRSCDVRSASSCAFSRSTCFIRSPWLQEEEEADSKWEGLGVLKRKKRIEIFMPRFLRFSYLHYLRCVGTSVLV